ncbi:MAG TPA: DUF1549 and DUF1553 domain-containing protein [Verrucomicrobiae bacterium]|nr:DUF1549 and DUF1553 domain-containing protein [Verrucomicrobiae bacterium]
MNRRLPFTLRWHWRSLVGVLVAGAGLVSSRGIAADSAVDKFTSEQRNLWSLQPVRRVEPPAPKNKRWEKTGIDAFILAGLEKKGLSPAPTADKATLLRRASLDLTGLPPTPAELDDFLRDKSASAFPRAVDRLLASSHYGERWARHWLDLARYAESEGFKADETRPNAWRYRDYVIRAFNEDKPYDRFIREQIAGDELWPNDPDALVATGFNRHYPDESNARNLMQRRQEILNDITDTVGAVFCGMTYACARCHNHKWDPILQADYYRLQAFFANSAASDEIVLASADAVKQHAEKLAVWEEKTRDIRDEMEKIEAPHRAAIIKDYVDKYPDEIQAALKKDTKERTPFECQMVAKAKLYLDPASHQYIASSATVAGQLKAEEKKRWQELKAELEKFASLRPAPLPTGAGIADVADESPSTHVLRRGVYDAPRDEVGPGFLTLLQPGVTKIVRPTGVKSSGRRTALANLLADPQNPLTARVMVNRVWQHHFGRGLVDSPSDFGLKGDRPSNPELLDWLATEFMRSGWSVKKLHRLIMTSAVYQQSSRADSRATLAAAKADPDDRLLWHFPRTRLEGETIRDAALFVSGRLNMKAGGPSVFPELPPGMESRGGWRVNEDQVERDRRSVYVFVRRNTRYPMFESFDMPDTHESCSRRNVTTGPVQALTLLNNQLTLDWARSMATRVLASAGGRERDQIDAAWRLAYARLPDTTERAMAREFFAAQERIIIQRSEAGEKIVQPESLPAGVSPYHGAALVDFCHALLNSNEFVYLQ